MDQALPVQLERPTAILASNIYPIGHFATYLTFGYILLRRFGDLATLKSIFLCVMIEKVMSSCNAEWTYSTDKQKTCG